MEFPIADAQQERVNSVGEEIGGKHKATRWLNPDNLAVVPFIRAVFHGDHEPDVMRRVLSEFDWSTPPATVACFHRREAVDESHSLPRVDSRPHDPFGVQPIQQGLGPGTLELLLFDPRVGDERTDNDVMSRRVTGLGTRLSK